MSVSSGNKIIEISYKRIFDNGTIFATIGLKEQGSPGGGVAAAENMKLENGKLISLDYIKKSNNAAFEQGGLFVLAFLLPWDRETYDQMAAVQFTNHPKTREIKWTYNMQIDLLGRPSHTDFD